MLGYVKWFNNAKGYGFIENAEGGADVFVHQSKILMDNYRTLHEGQQVEFEVQKRERGLEAVNVKPLS
jgi:CspA family cold shock protein